MLRIDRVLETALDVKDMARAIEFYHRVFGLEVLLRSAEPDRLTGLDVGGTQVLLLCKIDASTQAVTEPGGNIPPCDGGDNSHLAFPIPVQHVYACENHFSDTG